MPVPRQAAHGRHVCRVRRADLCGAWVLEEEMGRSAMREVFGVSLYRRCMSCNRRRRIDMFPLPDSPGPATRCSECTHGPLKRRRGRPPRKSAWDKWSAAWGAIGVRYAADTIVARRRSNE